MVDDNGEDAFPVEFSHALRKSVLEKTDRCWRITGDTLHIAQAPLNVSIPLEKIAELSFSYEPGRFTGNRYVMGITTNTGWRAEIDNQHWAGVGQFEDRSATFRPLAELLLARLRLANPQARLVTGSGSGMWLGMIVAASGLIALFMVVLMIGGPIIAMIKLAILAFFVPRTLRYIRVNRPQRLAITDEPPEGVLPGLFGQPPAAGMTG